MPGRHGKRIELKTSVDLSHPNEQNQKILSNKGDYLQVRQTLTIGINKYIGICEPGPLHDLAVVGAFVDCTLAQDSATCFNHLFRHRVISWCRKTHFVMRPSNTVNNGIKC